MTDKKVTEKDVLEAWEQEDKKGQFQLEVVDTADGKQTQILNKLNGSLIVAVDGEGSDALQKLLDNVRNPLVDTGESPKEQVETDEPRRTDDGVLATPTDPSSLTPATPTFIIKKDGVQTEVSEEEYDKYVKSQEKE